MCKLPKATANNARKHNTIDFILSGCDMVSNVHRTTLYNKKFNGMRKREGNNSKMIIIINILVE